MEKFKHDILKTIQICNGEIQKRKEGVEGESSIDQMEKIILPELKKLLVLLEKNQLPDKKDRYLVSFANAFTVWGWNMQAPTKLFLLLTQLNSRYKEL